MPSKREPEETRAFASREAWREWLEANHVTSRGLWVRLAKKGAGTASITYPEALEIALCFGWIDGQKKGDGDAWWLQRFTPRGARSIWSKINRAKAEALIASGAMREAGLREVERAKSDGRWDAAYDSPSTAKIPDDLEAALAKSAKARAFFAKLDATNRYAILHRLQTAKKPETRARRIEQFVAMLEKGEKIHER
ncbi:YdeI/OmpD-associated family protein [Sandaracinus amylolyticus]|uniref:YdeI/OmpD-associated family protein n=1 Tax=Sandaracinus amylolyticus TaxID=927083 RepID=UPI001F2ADF47|nr:YdeI/OmpD-associated family protein [Sandaracinus amylolyticus]UJR85885.1 Hypothetical protein I5071_79650 [Sandaracinus amylolyticus]